MPSFVTCSKCGGPMTWNEALQCWVCYGCEETAKRIPAALPAAITVTAPARRALSPARFATVGWSVPGPGFWRGLPRARREPGRLVRVGCVAYPTNDTAHVGAATPA